jgi:hypothetical protein
MTKHKATPEQWAQIELQAQRFNDDSCLIELRDRVEALELWRATTGNTAPVTRDRAEDAPESSDSLVHLVASAISGCGNVGPIKWWTPEARAAIREVADWLDQQHLHTTAARLRQEAR